MNHGITNKAPAPGGAPSTAITASPPSPGAGGQERGGFEGGRLPSRRKEVHPLWQILEVVASLRITVVLFALSILLVFYGTWAQVDQGVWTAVDKYFRSAIVLIPIKVLTMRLVDSNFVLPYPGGWLLGGLLLTNLLAAHAVRFKLSWKRSGIFMIHIGIIIMMLSEFFTGMLAVEGRMHIMEGQTVNAVQYEREPEIAVIDSSGAKFDEVVAIPMSYLKTGRFISHADLPFDIQIDQFMTNSKLIDADPKNNPATKGNGLQIGIKELTETSGTDPNQTIDFYSAFVSLRDKKTGAPMGTYLLSYYFFFMENKHPEIVNVEGKNYEISLRPRLSYRDFQIKLIDFRHDRYMGTNTPKNYQSDILLIDPEKRENRKVTISMNNPLRYGGETYYQASFKENDAGTVLQVVRNPAWTLPYISCIVVTLGMLFHFGLNLLTFLQKRMAQ